MDEAGDEPEQTERDEALERADRRTALFMILYLEEEAQLLGMADAATLLAAAALAVQEHIVRAEVWPETDDVPRYLS
jgi:hypothetical protein